MSRFKPSSTLPQIPAATADVGYRWQNPVTPPAAAQTEPKSASPRVVTLENPLHKIGIVLTLIYTALLSGYLNELIVYVVHVPLYLTLFLGPLGLLVALLSSQMRRAFTTRVGYCIVGLTLCYAASVPFSEYRSNSLRLLFTVIAANYAVFLMLAASVVNLKQCRRVMTLIACCGALDLVVSLKYGTMAGGRLAFVTGSLSNANDFAAHILSLLPFALFMVFDQGRAFVIRGLMVGICFGVFYASILTGSRGAILSMGVITLFALWKANPGLRLLLVGIFICIVPLGPTLAPQAWERVLTLFSNNEAYVNAGAASAVESTQARMHLLMRSLEVTFQHPLAGVGIGEFMDAEAGLSKEQGTRATWQVTHNTYTQVSSEAGIPALIFFLGALFGSVSLNFRLYSRSRKKPELKSITLMSFCLLMSMVSICVSMTFASWAYTYYMPLSAGLSVALWNASQPDLAKAGV